jgi:hypothetical protein
MKFQSSSFRFEIKKLKKLEGHQSGCRLRSFNGRRVPAEPQKLDVGQYVRTMAKLDRNVVYTI